MNWLRRVYMLNPNRSTMTVHRSKLCTTNTDICTSLNQLHCFHCNLAAQCLGDVSLRLCITYETQCGKDDNLINVDSEEM
ncbi:hypothetical protein LENED_004863 [Lentinula edodes]|uniref:Uncharacterized protein n=1 Tax=Lentinula edodes TaxID=5353 RepID=A0A1Q3E7E4_LENED|nr:hypothetical protein LENED_004863 [Lentinula edodes]